MTKITFRQTKIDTDIYGINSYLGISDDIDIDYLLIKSTIEYVLDLQLKSYGIQSIHVDIASVQCNIDFYIYKDELKEEEVKELISKGGIEGWDTLDCSFSFDYPKNEFKLINEAKFKEDGSFSFDNVSIDFKKKTIELS